MNAQTVKHGLMLIVLALLLTFMLTACGIYYGLKQTDPNRKPAGKFETWWMKKTYPGIYE